MYENDPTSWRGIHHPEEVPSPNRGSGPKGLAEASTHHSVLHSPEGLPQLWENHPAHLARSKSKLLSLKPWHLVPDKKDQAQVRENLESQAHLC